MAKDKNYELRYKIEGLKRITKRKIKKARKGRYKSLEKLRQDFYDREENMGEYY